MRRPPVVLALAVITVLALLVAVGLILFSVNPTTQSNQSEINRAVESQHAIICAQVQNTANAYRFRSLTPSGDVEPIRHFLTRMQAQRQTLRLVKGFECESAPGFLPVGMQIRRALNQIKRILAHFAPEQRKPVEQHQTSSFRHPSFSPDYSAPSETGVGEEGIPATLHDELAPSAPLGPQRGSEGTEPEPGTPTNPKSAPSHGESQTPVAPSLPPQASPDPPKAQPVPLPEIELEVPGLIKGKVGPVGNEVSISVVVPPEGELSGSN